MLVKSIGLSVILVTAAFALAACNSGGGGVSRGSGGTTSSGGGSSGGASGGAGGTATKLTGTGGAAGIGSGGVGSGGSGGSGLGGTAGVGKDGGPLDGPIDAAIASDVADDAPGCGPGHPAGSQWPQGDGCNTCYCSASGGSYFCTTRQCPPPPDAAPDAASDAALDAACAGDACGAIDARSVTDGSSPLCGDSVCSPTQLCIRPSCASGTAPLCLAPLDGGACPAGMIYVSSCPPENMGRGPGCTFPPCVDPPPFCVDVPAACGAKPTCSCLPYTVCGSGGGTCMLINSAVVQCGAA